MTNDHRQKILIVDDSPEEIRLLMQALRDDFNLSAATSADAAMQLLAENTRPDIILLDVNMPGTNGYEACKLIKADSALSDIDIIFLSSNDSTTEVLAGFDAGATDYVVKPYTPSILLSKIKQCAANRATKNRLAAAASFAHSMAMSAMTDTGDLGTVMNFLRASFAIRDIDQLTLEICNTLRSLRLNACAYLRVEDRNCYLCTENQASELEINVMQRLATSPEPIINIGVRMILIKPGIVLLIKNMPADADKASRIKDHLMILLEGVIAKIDNIHHQLLVDTLLNNNINTIINQAEQALIEIQMLQEIHKKRSIEIMENMVQQVEESFFPLGLTDSQEDQLLTIMSTSVGKALDHLEAGMAMDEKVKTIIQSLAAISIK